MKLGKTFFDTVWKCCISSR